MLTIRYLTSWLVWEEEAEMKMGQWVMEVVWGLSM